MTSLAQRQTLLPLVDKACHDGARLEKACRQIGLSARTVQRWQRPDRQQGDRRMAGQRAVVCPANQLSEAERQAALDMLNSDEFKDRRPAKSCPVWPIGASTWPLSRRCTACCAALDR